MKKPARYVRCTDRDPLGDIQRRAVGLLFDAARARDNYEALVACALASHGNGDGVLVSGVVRAHFPVEVKDTLRRAAVLIGDTLELSRNTWTLSGRRAATWFPLKDDIMTPPRPRRADLDKFEQDPKGVRL